MEDEKKYKFELTEEEAIGVLEMRREVTMPWKKFIAILAAAVIVVGAGWAVYEYINAYLGASIMGAVLVGFVIRMSIVETRQRKEHEAKLASGEYQEV